MTAAESPLAATPAGWLEPARDTGQAQRVERPPRIMVIDDDSAHLQVVRIIITRESFSAELLLQNDPLEALAYLEHNPVDLVLLDVGMSGLTGSRSSAASRPAPSTATCR